MQLGWPFNGLLSIRGRQRGTIGLLGKRKDGGMKGQRDGEIMEEKSK